MGVIDPRNTTGVPTGVNWNAPMYHHPSWTAGNLGEVFSLALDNGSPPNIYVAATSLYAGDTFGPGGPGGVYRISGSSGAITGFATIPNVGPVSLGKVAFDPAHQQLVVAELDRGLIHRVALPAMSVKTNPYDHGLSGRAALGLNVIPDSSAPGAITDYGRRIFAVQVFCGRVFYSVRNGPHGNEIWSVGLDANGDFILGGASGPRLEIAAGTLGPDLPPFSQAPFGCGEPLITDLAFSQAGLMLVSERTISAQNPSNLTTDAHSSRLREYAPSGAGWQFKTKFQIGPGVGNNSEGGADYNCAGWVFSTGDLDCCNKGSTVYGLQILPSGVQSITNSYLIDFDGNLDDYAKTQLGDVEVHRGCCECLRFSAERFTCLTNGQYQLSFCFTNLAAFPVQHLQLLDLPPGVTVAAATVNGSPVTAGPFVTLPAPVPPGGVACGSFTFALAPGTNLTRLCYRLAAHTPDLAECCIVYRCHDLPGCCLEFTAQRVRCGQATGTYSVQLTVQNHSPVTMHYVHVTPLDPCLAVTPGVFTPAGGLAPGATATLSFTVTAVKPCTTNPPAQFCFLLSGFDRAYAECCTLKHCLRLPACRGSIGVGGLPTSGTAAVGSRFTVTAELTGAAWAAEVTRMALLLDGTTVSEDTAAPWELPTGGLPAGAHVLEVAAYLAGETAPLHSDPVFLTVGDDATGGLPVVMPAPVLEQGRAVFRLQPDGGIPCHLEATDSLSSGVWQVVETIPGDGVAREVKVPVSGQAQRFFRIRMGP
jgi:hypothetical protein